MKITTSILSAHLCCTRAAVGDYLAHGVIERKADGGFDLDECRKRVLKHLRERSAGRTGNSGADLSAERAKLAVQQTKAAALRNELAAGRLCDVDIVQKHLERAILVLREQLLTIPGKHADECEGRTRAEIEEILRSAIYQILGDLAEGKHLAERAADETRR